MSVVWHRTENVRFVYETLVLHFLPYESNRSSPIGLYNRAEMFGILLDYVNAKNTRSK